MTSPALLLLFLAHVWPILSSPTQADHGNTIHTDGEYVPQRWTRSLETNAGLKSIFDKPMRHFDESSVAKSRGKREEDYRCEAFIFNSNDPTHTISHPHGTNSSNYYSKINCTTLVKAPKNKIIELTFIEKFHIEHHAECNYDYLEIRDGREGYAKLLGRVCGTSFPSKIKTSGPYAWLKFHSDETIEYEGFTIKVNFVDGQGSSVPDSCYHRLTGKFGDLDVKQINANCKTESTDLDILWTITTPVNTKIYLNFTLFELPNPNECEKNLVEVFGAYRQVDHRLAQFCGSIANAISTKDRKESGDDNGNVMNVRVFVDQSLKDRMKFQATYTAYRSLNPSLGEKCDETTEFDCEDYTCIDKSLTCRPTAHCRLKTDLHACDQQIAAKISDQTHILVILVIFSLILSAMCFVFLFKCIRKLYQDHKIIKEHIRQSCEDRLDSLVGSRLTLDPKLLQRDSEPRASLERENHANEMSKRKRESFSKRKPTSIDSEYIQETNLDEEEPWRREVDSVQIQREDSRTERNGRTRKSESERRSDKKSESERRSEKRSDLSKRESIKSKKESVEREIRDVSVGAPDTKESSCQTRESLFQTDPPVSSEGSNSNTNSRGFSTFGYSGATIARPSPAAASELTIELLRQVPKETVKTQKKIPDRRPISTETTRSAPDVIIVSKPIR